MKAAFQFVRRTGIWAPAIVLVFHQFVSVKDWRTQIDWINHYSGGLSFTYFAFKNLPALDRWIGQLTFAGNLGCSFLSGCTAALLWEIGEFSSDLIFHTTIQKSVNETMMDILNGFLGTITTVSIMGFLEYRRQRICAAPPMS